MEAFCRSFNKELSGLQQILNCITSGGDPELPVLSDCMTYDEWWTKAQQETTELAKQLQEIHKQWESCQLRDEREEEKPIKEEFRKNQEQWKECMKKTIEIRDTFLREYTRRLVENQCAMQ
jgi:hypothetical protein